MVALLLGAALAGCVDNDVPGTPLSATVGPAAPPAYTWPAPIAYDGLGNAVALPASMAGLDALPVGVEMLTGGGIGEPNLGVTKSGRVFVTTGDDLRASDDQGRNWEVVWDFVTPNYPRTDDVFGTSDPMMWVDTDTDRVFVNHMHPGLVCTYMAWSDKDGEPGTWTERPMDCGVPVLDHQKVMTAPPGPNTPPVVPAGVAYPNVLYMCVNKLRYGTWCAVSLDGGLSFAYDRQIHPGEKTCGSINGHPAAFPDGTVAVALGNLGTRCDRPLTVVVTEDSGLTWESRMCAPDVSQVEIDADITVTPDGTAYLLFRDVDELVYLARTKDKFETCDVFRVAPADHTLDVFTGITSGDDGRLAMSYLGTRDPQTGNDPDPSEATLGTHWHAFVTVTEDADAEVPTFVTTQVTPEEDPVQVGCVWLGGGGGGPARCRNLLDFIDMVHDADGRWYVAITDGCVPRNGCTGTPDSSDFQSRDSEVGILVQDRGWSLFADKGVLPSLGLEPPRPLPR